MNYIDKDKHSVIGRQIIEGLIDACWIEDQDQYINLNYNDGLCKVKDIRRDLTRTLLENQENYCCYCMKYIQEADTTLEHIIPQSTKSQDEFNKYLSCDEFRNNVEYSGVFDKSVKVVKPVKHSHDIAYYNLVAACDSNAHCNHYRGSQFIRPLFFDKDIFKNVEYSDDGLAYSSTYIDELAILGITTSEELLIYRRLWSLLSKTIATAEEVTEDDIEILILTQDFGTKFEKILNDFYGAPSKKADLLKYKWFYSYYK